MKTNMESNNTPQISDPESGSPLPNPLIDWIKNEFPDREITYRNKVFIFHADVPIDKMEDMTDRKISGVERVKYLLKILSIAPKITDEVLTIMGSTMLMDLYNQLFPKKVQESTPKEKPTEGQIIMDQKAAREYLGL